MLRVCNVTVTPHSSVRRGFGVLNDDRLTISVGSFVNSMAFCRITSPVMKQHPSTSVRYRRIVTHDVVIMTGHSNGRIRAWDIKTGELCSFVAFLAQDVIYTSRASATMSVSVCLSVMEVHWRIMANIRFKFRSKFTAHCRRGERSSQQQHLALC